MKFSIICPVYNSEKYLEECLQSFFNQTYNKWELIIVDDGSTDKTSQICEKFLHKYKNINYLYINNSGPYIARLKGLEISTGDYVIFVDSDDKIDCDALNQLYKKISTNNRPDIVLFNGIFKNEVLGSMDESKLFDYGIGYLKEQMLTNDLYNSVCMKCFSRTIYDFEILNKYSTRCKVSEDKIMLLCLLNKAKTIVYLNKILYFYRDNNLSTTKSKFTLNNIEEKYNNNLFDVINEFNKKWGNLVEIQNIYNYCLNAKKMVINKIIVDNQFKQFKKIISSPSTNHLFDLINITLFKKSNYYFLFKFFIKHYKNAFISFLYYIAVRFHIFINKH